ncbi:NUDIX hydrolase [Aspergillus foveolatus]|uniref:NUDIX hydrolase n=1 Tax=Aspergillus foveolatus TaxID=210207 RepID=UPI003CCCC21A
MSPKQKKQPADPRPSSSVVLISPKNEILLLHRVKTSTSFASAHVFPGGNLSLQDGRCPPPGDPKRHEDASWYRSAAIRELFEESGILLAKDQGSGKMLAVGEDERERGRREIHQKQTTFSKWLKKQNASAVPDIDNLIPFTRWITPINVPKRYTTQMYLYFLPLPLESEKSLLSEIPAEGEREKIQIPTSDGGVEIAEAQFLPPSEWLRKAARGEIILFPPQFVLLSLAAQFLDKEPRQMAPDELQRRREQLIEFAHSGSPPWTEKCISPRVGKFAEDGRAVLTLEHPGPELEGTDRRGESERAVLVRFKNGSARELSLAWKKDIFPGRKSIL